MYRIDSCAHTNSSTTPQRAGVPLGTDGIVPLVEASVVVSLVVIDPELRDETRETDEEGRVQDAFPQEELVPLTPE
jgi:hypothetical protein